MNVFAISDLHLSLDCDKPMDIFDGWDSHFDRISADWVSRVSDQDVVLLAGDHSWAMSLDQAMADLSAIGALPGRKVLLRGNHDYWWKAITTLRAALPSGMYALQNDCIRIDDLLVCGSRGWVIPDGRHDNDADRRVYNCELERLRLSLAAMSRMRTDTDTVVGMTHYPPFGVRFEDTAVTQLFDDYRIDNVVYGHLHGKSARLQPTVRKAGVDFHLTSCDLIDYQLRLILQTPG